MYPNRKVSTFAQTPSCSTKAFTLVELLVVIGIIALLISILLPSLARARQSATNVACQSNLRQVGMALQMYVGGNKDRLPWGLGPDWTSWASAISPYLGAPENATQLPQVLMCPDADRTVSAVRLHYTCNTRAFASKDMLQSSNPMVFWDGTCAPPVKLTSIRQSTETALIWDAPLVAQWGKEGGEASPVNLKLDNWGCSNFGRSYMQRGRNPGIEDYGPWALGDNSSNMQNMQKCNYDPYPSYDWDAGAQNAIMNGFRFRHLQNTSCNFLFADGHVEARKLGELKKRDYFVTIQLGI